MLSHLEIMIFWLLCLSRQRHRQQQYQKQDFWIFSMIAKMLTFSGLAISVISDDMP